MGKLRSLHRAWTVCLGGALCLFSGMGLCVNAFSVYQPFLISERGFTNTQISWISTVRSLFILAALLAVRRLCLRFGLRRIMTLGVALSGLSCLCFARAETFPACCAAAALTGAGYCFCGMVPLTAVIGNWFREHRNLALGLASAGSGVSTVLAPGILTALIRRFGMGTAFASEGVLLLAAAAAVWMLVRDTPASLGLEPYGRETQAQMPSAEGEARTLSGGRFAALLLAALLLGSCGGPGFSHLTVLFTSSGFTPETAASMIAWLGAALCVSKVLCGQVYDRAGGYRGNALFYFCFIASCVLCALVPLGGVPVLALTVTLFAMGMPLTVMAFSEWTQDLFGSGYGRPLQIMTAVYTLGMLLFGPMPGTIADAAGRYSPAYLIFAGMLLVSMALVQGVYRREGLV